MKQSSDNFLYRKIIILSFVTIGLLFGLFFIVLVPTIRSVRIAHSNFLTQKRVAESLLKAGSTESVIQTQVAGLDKSVNQLNDNFLIPGKEIEFIQFLESSGRDNGIEQTIQLNDPSFDKTENFYPSALLIIKVQGRFLRFLRYLIDLEKGPYYINISSVSLSSSLGDLKTNESAAANQRPFAIISNPILADLSVETSVETDKDISATITGRIFWQH